MILNLCGLLFLSCIETIDVDVPKGTVFYGESYLMSFEVKGEKNGLFFTKRNR